MGSGENNDELNVYGDTARKTWLINSDVAVLKQICESSRQMVDSQRHLANKTQDKGTRRRARSVGSVSISYSDIAAYTPTKQERKDRFLKLKELEE